MTGMAYMGIQREKLPWFPEIDQNKCTGCGTCLETCPNNVFVIDDKTSISTVKNSENCVVLCDKCSIFCPEEAISFPDKEEMKQMISRLLRETQNSGT